MAQSKKYTLAIVARAIAKHGYHDLGYQIIMGGSGGSPPKKMRREIRRAARRMKIPFSVLRQYFALKQIHEYRKVS